MENDPLKSTVEAIDLPLLPLRDVVVYPHMVIPLFVGRPGSVEAVNEALNSNKLLMLVTQRDATKDNPEVEDLYDVGMVCMIMRTLKLPDGRIRILVQDALRDVMDGKEDAAGRAKKIRRQLKALRMFLFATVQTFLEAHTHSTKVGTKSMFDLMDKALKRLKQLESMHEDGSAEHLVKKEVLQLTRERDKLERSLGGIKDMKSLPDALFVVDVSHEDIAIKEARKLGIPVIAIVDTNCDPDQVDLPIPGNDDSIRSIDLIVSLLADAIGHGTSDEDAFHHWQAREITIEADPPQHVIGDGELWGETPISLKVLPQAVQFVVGENS